MMHPLLIGSSLNTGLSKISRLTRPSVNSIRWKSTLELDERKVGDIIHGYKLEKIDYIKELNIKPYLLRHQATGAEHLHVSKTGDTNNAFAVSLRTTPKDSTGVAHILEHLALCGSKKYAVRDPFFKMRARSLATFMNAMTSPDSTIYPFSTQNKQDFKNLLSVYVDAVFFPRLRPVDFRQEGWRLEHEKPDKKETPIVIRGVVYNEMKGVFSSSSTIYSRYLLNSLFPDTTYKYESGGDPECIPNLSHDELKKFHKLHYHPSNAKFFTYGDIPLEEHLELLNQMVMSKFSENIQAREKSLVIEQESWKEPRTVEITCPPDPSTASSNRQTTTSISYMLPTTINNLKDIFYLQILSELLISGPNAPLYKNLLESGLGADYSPSTGIETSTKQPYFSVGLKDIAQEDISKVHDLIGKTLSETAANGFPEERVDAILHNIELGVRHIGSNFGLRMLMSIGSTFNHDGDVIDSLKINKFVNEFKKELSNDPQYWNKIITKYFLKNSHKLILNMSPQEDFEEKRKEREEKLLNHKVNQLDDVSAKTVLYEGMELLKIQNTKEDPSILPCLDPSKDIPKELPYKTGLRFESYKGVNIQICEPVTNGVVYFRAIMDISEKMKSLNLVDYLPLFCDVATKLGAGSLDRHKFAQQSQLTTGGLSVNLLINPSLSEFDQYRNEVLISSRCLQRNIRPTFDLWAKVFQKIHFDENKEYLSQLIKATASELVSEISYSGNQYAAKKAASSLSNLSALDERLSGLSFVARMKAMAFEESIETVTDKLKSIANIVFDPANMRCALNMDSEVSDSTISELRNFIDTIQDIHSQHAGYSAQDEQSEPELSKVGDLKLSFATHFVAKSIVTVPRLHVDFPKLVIMSELVESKYLLREIREKGGAYGTKLAQSNSGILSFSSYRDPNTTNTLRTFDYATLWVEDGSEYSERDIEESKLLVFQKVDKPVEPGRRGLSHFLQGETDEMRQDLRRQLLEVTKSDVQAVAREYLTGVKFGTYII